MTEQLTKEDREWLAEDDGAGTKYLRILDAQAETLGRVRAVLDAEPLPSRLGLLIRAALGPATCACVVEHGDSTGCPLHPFVDPFAAAPAQAAESACYTNDGACERHTDCDRAEANAKIAELETVTVPGLCHDLDAANARADVAERSLLTADKVAQELLSERNRLSTERDRLSEAFNRSHERELELERGIDVLEKDQLAAEEELHAANARADKAEPDENTESIIEQLDEALCTLLHVGGEVGIHSPREHLALFYALRSANQIGTCHACGQSRHAESDNRQTQHSEPEHGCAHADFMLTCNECRLERDRILIGEIPSDNLHLKE